MCLLLGSPSVGKTLLLKRLNACSAKGNFTDVGEAPATIPTVGTNLMNISVSRRAEVTVRELGGCMSPIWKNYYDEDQAVMFVVDKANRSQISSACILLLEILNNEKLQQIAVLLVLNKCDLQCAMKRDELEYLMRVGDILKHATQNISIIETSAKSGQGLQSIVKWLQQHCKTT